MRIIKKKYKNIIKNIVIIIKITIKNTKKRTKKNKKKRGKIIMKTTTKKRLNVNAIVRLSKVI